MCVRFFIAVFLLLFIEVTRIGAQSESSLAFSGYLKNMQTAVFPGENQILLENLIHNRLNFRWFVNENFYFAAEARNRVFAGNMTALTPDFGQSVQESSDDWLPLSVLWLDEQHYAIHSTLDRLFFDYTKGKWNIRVGRQRVNWGVNLAFNPNDLFNAYNFLDFDYEERPGSDALRVQYFTNFASGFDLAIKGADNLNSFVGALRWYTNVKAYDIQLIGGLSRGDLAIGGAWAGQIKNAGWKGELTYFHPIDNSNRTNAFSASSGIDYTFGKGWYLYGGYLYNSDAGASLQDLLFQTEPLSARNLFPLTHSILTQVSYPVSPIVSLSGSVIYAPSVEHPLIINPSLAISLAQNWDLNIVWQSFLTLGDNSSGNSIHLAFLRIRWSF
jgi:hypothetical protein